MNILYLSADRGIPIYGHKGASVHIRALSAAFARAGGDVTILAPRLGEPFSIPLPAKLVQVQLLAIPSAANHSSEQARERQAQIYADRLFLAACQQIRQRHVDFIYERYSLWSDVGARVANATGLPFVLEVNAPLRQEAAKFRSLDNDKLARAIEYRQFETASAIAVVSAPLQDYVARHGGNPARIHIVPNGVDSAKFHPAVRGGKAHSRHGLNGCLVIGFIGRPRPWHDLETLLKATATLAAEDDRIRLLLVGQMPADLPQQLKQFNLDAITVCPGAIPHEQIPIYIAAMDVAVCPHLALPNFYFSPLKLAEYLACGAPTVAADIGQPAEIIQHKINGLLYPPGDSDALADAIRWLFDHPAQTREMAWRGAKLALKKFSWDENARKVMSWTKPKELTKIEPPLNESISMPILDDKLRQRLYRATRPDLALPILAHDLPAFYKRGNQTLEQISRIELLKYKKNRRCVLKYTLQARFRRGAKKDMPVTRHIVGKLFRDNRGKKLHKLQSALVANGFGSEAADGVCVPASLAYVPKMRMQTQMFEAGDPLHHLARTGAELSLFMPRAAQAIAKLHRWRPPPTVGDCLRVHLLADEIALIGRFANQLSGYSNIKTTQQKLIDWGMQLPALPAPLPVHRDFYYSQILFTKEKTILIDFDLFAWGDPAIDLANFIMHLHLLGLDIHQDWSAFDAEIALFVRNYQKYIPMNDAFNKRLAFYKTATNFRMLHIVSARPFWAHFYGEVEMRLRNGLNL